MSESAPTAAETRRLAEEARDRVRFEEEALQLSDQVFRVARRMVNSREEAEDLVQDTYARAFRSWQPYAVAGAGLGALLLIQSAYQAGPLAYSMPFVGVLEPLVAVVIGDIVLGEAVRLTEAQFMLELAAAAVACLGILLLTTSQTVLSIYEERPAESASAPLADFR